MNQSFDPHIQRLWARQLAKEYEQVCYAQRVGFSRPVIEVADLKGRWGSWDPLTRTIQISRNLILSYSWDIVVKILKHEMAHQYVTDLLNSDEGHGPRFKAACEVLGVEEEFRSERIQISEKSVGCQHDGISSESQKLLNKVNKLLAVAGSDNEHEASLAMERAQVIISKYNLDRIENSVSSKYVYSILSEKKKRIEAHQSYICSILSEFYFVTVVYSDLYCATDVTTYKTIEILGTQENVIMAEYVYHFLMETLQRLWKVNSKTAGMRGARAKRSYCLGVLSGLRSKLGKIEEQQRGQATTASEKKLMVKEDQNLEVFVSKRFPRLSARRSSNSRVEPSAYCSGQVDGAAITIHKPVEERSKFGGFLTS